MRLKQTSQELSTAISLRETERRTSRTQAPLRLSHFSTFCQKRHRHFIIHTRTHLLPPPPNPPSQRKQALVAISRQWMTGPQDSSGDSRIHGDERGGPSRNTESNVSN
ncbi:hypothetical protein CEXT_152761 [Caerostris extrusa]|uniref:Uncharacterized protein n=1 Tax=Caerostris extrusa TaxID=172846 RepID=A0AAV4TCM5_CAEEX|nr:hypothetical protein CEXT_152761 [Caerostris extrusa]